MGIGVEEVYRPRLADALIDDLLTDLPAILVLGPRAVGKTTTAARRAKSVVHLDRSSEAGGFLADPDVALRSLEEPILLDEWQVVPEVLGAVKRAVDGDSHPGRFLVTGSVRAALQSPTWPGTERLVTVVLYGMTVREQLGRLAGPLFLDRLAGGDTLTLPEDIPDVRGYLELGIRSGFPEALARARPSSRNRWLSSYINELVTRDALELGESRDPQRLRRFLAAYALNSAGVVADDTLTQTADLNRRTADAYERLLKDLFIVATLPAWLTNRLSRLVKMPKRFVTDCGLLATLLNADVRAILADANLLGRFVESFIVSQLIAELDFCESRPQLYHLRDANARHEVDIVIEYGAGNVVGIEVKAASAVRSGDADHLRWLRSHLGSRFLRGVILHTGPRLYQLEEGIIAAPIAALWG